MREFPLQLSKVQRPPLRREILRRERLLDWLKVKIHHRVVLVTAEAGYGKTTLLADFARHHRRPTMWYRLDEDDRNWVSFVHYLVAAGRTVDPEFGTATRGLLAELGLGAGPSRDTIFATYLRDLQSLGSGGAALIIDDFHLVDDIADIRVLMRDLVARGPERLTIVLAARQTPTLPLARLRTLGEVAEMNADDLRFDLAETERLFRDTYGRPLEPDVLADLTDRTEGWAASLEMVNAAMRDRPPSEVRAFVRTLTGAHGDLYDYLAEELISDLDPSMRQFLMETSLLQVVDPAVVRVITGLADDRCLELLGIARRLGLLARRGAAGRQALGFHPLVREFLEARLKRTAGEDVVRELHRKVADHTRTKDWRLAAHHYASAGDTRQVREVVEGAVPSIMGTGEFALAASFLEHTADEGSAPQQLLASRMDLHRGQSASALRHAETAVDLALSLDDRELGDYALANMVNVLYQGGELDKAREVAETLSQRTNSAVLKPISVGMISLIDGSRDANLDDIRAALVELAGQHERTGLGYYAGITWLNIADLDRARGDIAASERAARLSIDALSGVRLGFEIETARIALIWALALKGDWESALLQMNDVEQTPFEAVRGEVLVELAEIHTRLGDATTAEGLVERAAADPALSEVFNDLIHLIRAEIELRRGDSQAAGVALAQINHERPHPTFGFVGRLRFAIAMRAILSGEPEASSLAASSLHLAAAQGARPLASASKVLLAIADGSRLDEMVEATAADYPWTLSILAEALSLRLDTIGTQGSETIALEARRRPTRWREPLRAALKQGSGEVRLRSATLLDEIGERRDIALLRAVAKSLRGRPGAANLGRGLSHRLAKRVVVMDQGRVHVRVGDEVITGTDIRRKVLALLCFLITRPQLAATRDQVLEALWPDFEPDVAGNSLNQTVYFLRRVFEPEYDDEISPGYVHHGSDVVWLDPGLVTSHSRQARLAMRTAEADPTPEHVEAVSAAYIGRFALDFAYEDWAVPYRDTLHAAYLEISREGSICRYQRWRLSTEPLLSLAERLRSTQTQNRSSCRY